MKEVEFINSRVEQQVRSRRNNQQWEYPVSDCPTDTKNTGPSDLGEETPCFNREERKAIVTALRKFADTVAIYRLTLDNCARTKNLNEYAIDLDDNDTIIRLREESSYVSRVLDDLIRDIDINGRYDSLTREIEGHMKKRNDEIAIMKEYEETRKKLQQLGARLEEETQANSREIKRLEEKLVRLKNEKKRLEHKANIELEYVMAKEEARRETNSLRCNIDLQRLRDTLGNLSLKEKYEHRVTTDIVNFLEQNISEIEEATNQWQERYDREMLMYKTENERLAEEIENKTEALEKLQLEFREKQQFIDSYEAEKEAARDSKKREEHRRDCAIRIQAWWRGVMVRRKLGPYRPDERKKKRAVKSKK